VEKLSEAKVLAVGPGGIDKDGKRVEMSVAPGDKVLIPPVGFPRCVYRLLGTDLYESQYGGSPVKVGDEEYTLFRDHE